LGSSSSDTIRRQWLILQRLSRNRWTGTVELDPLAIVQRGAVLYLIAVGKSLSGGKATAAIRLFAMHRFKKAWLRDEKVESYFYKRRRQTFV
jgi:hypothetical protein